MSTRATSIVVLLGVACAALSTFYCSRSGEPADAIAEIEPPPGARAALAALGSESRQVSVDSSVAATSGVGEPAASASNDQRSPQAASSLLTPPTAMARALQIWQDRRITAPGGFAAADKEFVAEAIDPLWAPAMEARIVSEIAQISGLKLVSILAECRTTMCRLQLTQTMKAPPSSELFRARDGPVGKAHDSPGLRHA
jgi:hypothetical protein